LVNEVVCAMACIANLLVDDFDLVNVFILNKVWTYGNDARWKLIPAY